MTLSRVQASCLNNVVDFGWDEGRIDPAGLKRVGADLLIHRATRGGDKFDDDYASRELPARRAGLAWGAYHYIKRSQLLDRQIGLFLHRVATVAKAKGTSHLPVLLVLDNEGRDRISWAELARAARMVRARAGILPVLYASIPQPNGAQWAVHLQELERLSSDDRALLRDCSLWVPRYGDHPSTQQTLCSPRLFGGWTLWQYCGDIGGRPKYALDSPAYTGHVGYAFTRAGGKAGICHFCDRSVFRGSHSDFQKFLACHSSAVTSWR